MMMPRTIIMTRIIPMMLTLRQHEAADGSLRTLTERRGRVVKTGPGSWLLLKVEKAYSTSKDVLYAFCDRDDEDGDEFILCEIQLSS